MPFFGGTLGVQGGSVNSKVDLGSKIEKEDRGVGSSPLSSRSIMSSQLRASSAKSLFQRCRRDSKRNREGHTEIEIHEKIQSERK